MPAHACGRVQAATQLNSGTSDDVAQHDAFWKAETEAQRRAAQAAQARVAELDATVARLKDELAAAGAAAAAATTHVATGEDGAKEVGRAAFVCCFRCFR